MHTQTKIKEENKKKNYWRNNIQHKISALSIKFVWKTKTKTKKYKNYYLSWMLCIIKFVLLLFDKW